MSNSTTTNNVTDIFSHVRKAVANFNARKCNEFVNSHNVHIKNICIGDEIRVDAPNANHWCRVTGISIGESYKDSKVWVDSYIFTQVNCRHILEVRKAKSAAISFSQI